MQLAPALTWSRAGLPRVSSCGQGRRGHPAGILGAASALATLQGCGRRLKRGAPSRALEFSKGSPAWLQPEGGLRELHEVTVPAVNDTFRLVDQGEPDALGTSGRLSWSLGVPSAPQHRPVTGREGGSCKPAPLGLGFFPAFLEHRFPPGLQSKAVFSVHQISSSMPLPCRPHPCVVVVLLVLEQQFVSRDRGVARWGHPPWCSLRRNPRLFPGKRFCCKTRAQKGTKSPGRTSTAEPWRHWAHQTESLGEE